MPIKIRLTLLFSLVSMLIFGIAAFIFVSYVSSGLRSSLVSDLRTKAYILGQNSSGGSQSTGGTGSSVSDIPSDLNGSGNASPVQVPALPFSLSVPNSKVLAAQIVRSDRSVVESYAFSSSRLLIRPSRLAQASKSATWYTSSVNGSSALVLAQPVKGSSNEIAVVAASLSGVSRQITNLEMILGVVVLFGSLIAAIAAWVLSGAALSPVSRMADQVEGIYELKQWRTLEVPGTNDEVAHLARTMATLLNRLDEASSRQRGFIAVAGHELRTPLAILKGELELAQKTSRTPLDLREAVSNALVETEKLVSLTERLLLLARNDEGEQIVNLTMVDLWPLLDEICGKFRKVALSKGVEIELLCDPSLVCRLDPIACRQILGNLLDNAISHSPDGSTIKVTCSYQTGSIVLMVSDQGGGFNPDFLPNAFGRFTRDEDHRDRKFGGAGLGLSIVQALVNAHLGKVVAKNNSVGGATIEITLPAPEFLSE